MDIQICFGAKVTAHVYFVKFAVVVEQIFSPLNADFVSCLVET